MNPLIAIGWLTILIANIYSANDKPEQGLVYTVIAIVVFILSTIFNLLGMV